MAAPPPLSELFKLMTLVTTCPGGTDLFLGDAGGKSGAGDEVEERKEGILSLNQEIIRPLAARPKMVSKEYSWH
jgi:hypothetical protein